MKLPTPLKTFYFYYTTVLTLMYKMCILDFFLFFIIFFQTLTTECPTYANIKLGLGSSFMEGRVVPVVTCVGVSPVLEEQ